MRTRYALPALAAAAALMLTGCVDNSAASDNPSDEGEATTSVVNAAAVALLPAGVADSGVLTIATSPNYPPNEFKDEAGTPIGWGVELSEAIAGTLGLKPEFTISRFESIIPGIVGGQIDVGSSSFTDNPERQKQVDFVNYFTAGVQWGSRIDEDVDPANACGLKVAVQATTFQDTDEIPAKSEACVAEGKAPIEKLPFDTQDAAVNAVVLGQADAFSGDSPVSLYAISKLKDKLQPAGETFDVSPYGLAVEKDSGMAEAIQAALQAMVDDGSYAAILEKWGVGAGGLTEITINAGAVK